MKYAAKCGEDLWSCLMEECVELNLNSRMNLLYLLDSLLSESSIYSELIQQDLSKLIDLNVPNTTEGILNKINTVQVR